jgi:uncharacterized protein DUF6538
MVEHIMRLAAYLSTSRHGIFYFRFPIPADRHPSHKRSHLKVSLGTRDPRHAQRLSRLLTLAGQSALARPMVSSMRYDEMRDHVREHFCQLLRDFREKSAATGPASGMDLDALKAGRGLADGDPDDWAAVTPYGDGDGLLRAFCELRGISEVPEDRERVMMVAELQKGYRDYIARALEHTAEFSTLAVEQDVTLGHSKALTTDLNTPTEVDAMPLADVVSRYFDELQRTNALATKTEGEKRDALALMSELTGDKPLAHMTKTEAQNVKAALFKLPKNRRKNPKTRDLPLSEALEVSGVERIAARTMNVYLGHKRWFGLFEQFRAVS